MQETRAVELTRDCNATQIPAGATVVLPAGTQVDITQQLGGSFTVQAPGGLFRIANQDADALGRSVAGPPLGSAPTPAEGSAGAVDETVVWTTLKSCFDPEIPVNIVDLGLVYDMRIEPS